MSQDWTVVTWDKRPQTSGKANPSNSKTIAPSSKDGSVGVTKKFLSGQNKATKHYIVPNASHIDEDTGDYRIERVSPEFSKALQRARMDKKLTQAQLAKLINERVSAINEYENGKAIPNPMVIQKLGKALGTRLPSAKKKEAAN
ncbi:putative multiprotein bridging factor type 1 family transcriptional co-activator [Cardiosporidium cionae]|uniref:Multiprotein bridging factor type 1 family transcriptional co-activator n=1 Tax=Cardiosporidium cionae TaxID=476202 RepID=A0ABQ7J6B2_9APIC|nr:putative multiprotein bridging factor type 1 family transcriptional co-activator [Cardiosporidium cionae]|eukprot:KAF8819523.1 putative multiprotein bridging factor type 1 family transcriptional co-activator [Cardiosporidium cionae]